MWSPFFVACLVHLPASGAGARLNCFDPPALSGFNTIMLGRLTRTTPVDVGLAMPFAGVAYLVWALVAGVSRATVQAMIHSTHLRQLPLPGFTDGVKIFFVDLGFVIDVVGLVWLGGSLVLVWLASRQVISISWVWVSAFCQSSVAALGAVLVGWAAYQPHLREVPRSADPSLGEQVSHLSLPIIIGLAILLWAAVLVLLLLEQAKFRRRGPTLRDGLRTNLYR